jgi:hypothetical protein
MEHQLGNIVESTWRQGRDHPAATLFGAHDDRVLGAESHGRVWFKAG